jgi:ribosomal protein L11 methyltransferase
LSADPDRTTIAWKVTLPCTRAEAEAIREDVPALALLAVPPALITSERDPARPDEWQLDAYFETKPGKSDIALLKTFVPHAAAVKPRIEALTNADWVSLSQQGLEPIRAGRFFVHTPAFRASRPADGIAFEIDAGLAFGTGHHATTTGCLLVLDRLKRSGANFANILDLGTGTGLLAFAALRLWPTARVAASDVDPIAVEVSRENARINAIRLGRSRGQIELLAAAGIDHPRLRARAPYDLIVANILAGPLIELAATIAVALAPGGRLILAGLLDRQAALLETAYRRHGMMAVTRLPGEWPVLVMRKRRRSIG